MIRVTTFAGRNVAVFGLGASGRATALALLAGGASVFAWDDGIASRDAAASEGIPVVDLRTSDWTSFAAFILAPGVPLTHPEPHWTVGLARAAGVEVIGDIELFFRERAHLAPNSPIVAITGTNGKSTTTALIAHILASAGRDAQMGGNIGRAILTLEPPSADRIHVIEMSSFQIDLTPSLAPTIGVLLNLSPDHLDRHGTMENYAAIKERLVAAAKSVVIGIDDELTAAIADRLEQAGGATLERLTVGAELPGGWSAIDQMLRSDAERHRTADSLPRELMDLEGHGALRGAHNAQNALAATAVCDLLGIEMASILAGIRTYPGLPHRMEEVGRAGSVVFVNDSKATNADSTEKALASWPRDIFWIVGGKAKEGGIAPLERFFPRIAKAYLIGASSDAFAASLEGRVPFGRCETLDVAVAEAANDAMSAAAMSGDIDTSAERVVLLSPACASYDQFRSFEHRGDVFRTLVQDLLAKVPGPRGSA
jgi:UDP-N-acetylmuramoylalanine--D-glutamate ligase